MKMRALLFSAILTVGLISCKGGEPTATSGSTSTSSGSEQKTAAAASDSTKTITTRTEAETDGKPINLMDRTPVDPDDQ